MTTSSDTPTTEPADPAVREWCCGTLITGPHADGCGYEPQPDQPVDYTGPAVTQSDKPVDNPAPAAEWVHPDGWDHEWLDFHGDRLAIRKPRESVVNALVMVNSARVSEQTRGGVISTIVQEHLSPESFERVLWRSISPDDPDYTLSTLSDLVEALINMAMPTAAPAGETPAQEG